MHPNFTFLSNFVSLYEFCVIWLHFTLILFAPIFRFCNRVLVKYDLLSTTCKYDFDYDLLGTV